MSVPHALIAGAGGALGRSLVSEFAGAGYAVSALRRTADAAPPAHAFGCDFNDPADTGRAVSRAIDELGPVDTLVFNAAHLVVAPFAELKAADFEAAWRVSVLGAMACAQAVLPGMLARGHGTLIFTGATASLRGAARFAAFASAKFALRGLAQSLAREHHAQGIHVAHVVLDGLLRGSESVRRFGGDDAKALDPAEVARSYRWLAEQPTSAWVHELDLRPASEKF